MSDLDNDSLNSPPADLLATIPLSPTGNLPYHIHNGVDSPKVNYNDLLNLPTLLPDPVTVAHGGTGQTSLSAHGVLIGNGTTAVTISSPGTTGQVLTSNGASSDPTFQTLAPQSPAWVDEGTVSWSATSTAQTLTPTNAGRNIYMLIFTVDFTVGSSGNELWLQMNGDGGNSYNFNTLGPTGTTANTGPTSFLQLATVNSSEISVFTGIIYINGSKETATNTYQFGVSCNIMPFEIGTGQTGVMLNGAYSASAILSSFTLLFNGKTTTGKLHAYSLNI